MFSQKHHINFLKYTVHMVSQQTKNIYSKIKALNILKVSSLLTMDLYGNHILTKSYHLVSGKKSGSNYADKIQDLGFHQKHFVRTTLFHTKV